MRKSSSRCFLALASSVLALALNAAWAAPAQIDVWPARPAATPDPALEAKVEKLLAGLSLKQKIGQMTQAEIQTITPTQVREYAIGSVLNGGGSWPGKKRMATVEDWRNLSKEFQRAALAATPGVGLIWGIDAVHGNNNIHGATLFPHHTGLGATRDAALVRDIGRATAAAVRAAGIQWVFAPTLAVVQDVRWGRTYEGYGADPALVKLMGQAEIEGMQEGLSEGRGVVATAKHFVGDGGTTHGVDQGLTRISFAELATVHGVGYYGALDANVQTVMASFNSWQDSSSTDGEGKMHGSELMLTEVLKKRLGFDGFVISDWDGVGQVPGCKNDDCPQAINAGVDMIMLSKDWRGFIKNTLRDVQEGRIPMARVDDAVRRILRVKLRAGIASTDGVMPADLKRLFAAAPAGDLQTAQQNDATAALARRAVRESLVLLKNDKPGLLPLARSARVLVIGSAADSMAKQAGGWSKTWLGDDNTNADFPQGQTALAALRAALGADHVVFDADAKNTKDASGFDAVIAVIGEKPYAEGAGDIKGTQSLRHSVRYPEDLAVLERAKAWGKPVVTVLFSGRPLYVNDLAARSDAFIAAWLPGTEGAGLADMLVMPASGKPNRFTGRLSFPWPAAPCQFGTKGKDAWWPVGAGLAGDEKDAWPAPADVADPAGGCPN